jgi:hypothetical protein
MYSLCDPFTETCVPVDEHIRQRFAEAYARWKAGEEGVIGTRLSDWGQSELTAKLLQEFEALHVKTVEDLANISDSHIGKLIHGRVWRGRAIEFLRTHPRPQDATEMQQLLNQNEELLSRISKLEKKEADRAKMALIRSKRTPDVG